MPAAPTLGHLLRWRAQQSPDLCAYQYLWDDGTTTSLTYGELDAEARAIAAAIQSYVEVGQRALLIYPPGLEFLSAFLGCVYAGVLAVPSTPPKPRRPMSRIATIAEDSLAVIALTTSQTLSTIDQRQLPAALQEVTWIASDDLALFQPADWGDPGISADHLAFLQYTSGSISDPKGVMISHRNLMSNMEMIRCGFGIQPTTAGKSAGIGVSWLPPYHDMGLIGGMLESMYVGGSSLLLSPASFLKRPERWLQAISENRATISGAPNFAFEMCLRKIESEQRDQLDLSSWRVAFCGAEPVQAETLDRFSEKFGPCGFQPEAFYPCYGMAETTLLASGGHCDARPTVLHVNRAQLLKEGRAEPNNGAGTPQALVSCGQPIHDEQLAIVDPKDQRRCPPGKVGEIWVAGPNVAMGYWNQVEDTESHFAARIADSSDGPFLRTGDLGFLYDDQLYVTGRLKELLIVRGRNYYPHDIERTMQRAHECLLPNAGAAFTVDSDSGEQIVLVQEVDRAYRNIDLDQVTAEIRRSVVEEYEVEVQAVVLIRQASLPRTTSGKLQRHRCRQQHLEGDLKILAQWFRPQAKSPASGPSNALSLPTYREGELSTSEVERLAEQVETQLLEWLLRRIGPTDGHVDRDRPFAELGIDSLAAVELSAELEAWSGVEMSSVVAWKYPTPATLSRYLACEIGRRHGTKELGCPPVEAPENDELERLLAEVEQMSDEEAAGVIGEPTDREER